MRQRSFKERLKNVRQRTGWCMAGVGFAACIAVVAWMLVAPTKSAPTVPPPSSLPKQVIHQAVPVSAPKSEGYNLHIEKLGLDVPIVINVDARDSTAYLQALTRGVAHMLGTALPGAPGNAVIFGHSSAPADYTGAYGTAFSTLHKLSPDDQVIITSPHAEHSYAYRVTGKKIVAANDTSLIQQNLGSRLTLVTCWPVGSDRSRLVVWAAPE